MAGEKARFLFWLVVSLIVFCLVIDEPCFAQRSKQVHFGEAALWDVATGQKVFQLKGFEEKAVAVAFSPNGKMVAVGGWRRVIIYDPNTGDEMFRDEDNREYHVLCLAFAPRQDELAVGYSDFRRITIFSLATKRGRDLWAEGARSSSADSVHYSPDGKTLVVGGGTQREKPGKVEFMDLETDKTAANLDHPEMVFQVVVSPDGNWLAVSGGDLPIKLYDWKTRREKFSIEGRGPVAFSGDSKVLVTCNPHRRAEVWFWGLETGKKTSVIVVDSPHATRSLALSKDGKRLATGGAMTQPLIQLWDTQTGKPIRALEGSKVAVIQALAFSPDGKTLATAGWDIRKVETKEVVAPRGDEECSEGSDSSFWSLALLAGSCGVAGLLGVGAFLWFRRGRPPCQEQKT